MCDELGDEKYMEEYVMEMGGVYPCALDGEGCSEKEVKYLNKWKEKTEDDVNAQVIRLQGMMGGKMKPSLMKWIKQRIGILKQIQEAAATPAHEEL